LRILENIYQQDSFCNSNTMPNHFVPNKDQIWSRRQFLKLGLVGVGASSAGLLWLSHNSQSKSRIKIPPIDSCLSHSQIFTNINYLLSLS
jgi:hypothetical protein